MSVTIPPLSEQLLAVFALEWTRTRMRAHMVLDVAQLREKLAAGEALKHLIPPTCLFVYSADFSPFFAFRDKTPGPCSDCRLLDGWHFLARLFCHGLRFEGYSAKVYLITIFVFLVYLGSKHELSPCHIDLSLEGLLKVSQEQGVSFLHTSNTLLCLRIYGNWSMFLSLTSHELLTSLVLSI